VLTDDAARYVAMSRHRGLCFNTQERILKCFARYADAHHDRYARVDRINEWCRTASSPNQARVRYDTVRLFCLFLRAEDSQHEVPPAGAFGRGRRKRPAPFILEPSEIQAIMQAALRLPPEGTITPHTYHYLFGILATTGLRISEAMALKHADVTADGLIVRGKFGKRRLVPLHPSTRRALAEYQRIRSRLGGNADDLFVVTTGKAPHKTSVHIIFVRLARALGLRGPKGTRGPRLHDLRHSFAVRSLEACAHDRNAVGHHMLGLSTYLGHSDVAHTYWYLEATTVLMQRIADANEQHFLGGAA